MTSNLKRRVVEIFVYTTLTFHRTRNFGSWSIFCPTNMLFTWMSFKVQCRRTKKPDGLAKSNPVVVVTDVRTQEAGFRGQQFWDIASHA